MRQIDIEVDGSFVRAAITIRLDYDCCFRIKPNSLAAEFRRRVHHELPIEITRDNYDCFLVTMPAQSEPEYYIEVLQGIVRDVERAKFDADLLALLEDDK